jgi:hypothetical protein
MTPSSTPHNPELATHLKGVAGARGKARELMRGLTDDQFNWCPDRDHWSIAQCLDHLAVTGEKLVPRLAWGIAEARRKQWLAPGPFRYGFLGNWIVKKAGAEAEGGEYPPRRRFRVPRIYTPASTQTMESLVPRFHMLQEQWTALLQKADGVDLARIKITSPASRLVRLSLGQWFTLVIGHQRRHLLQARWVREHAGFPAGNSDVPDDKDGSLR